MKDPIRKGKKWKVACGDSLKVLRSLKENSVDACVTDPPYEIGMMGKSWDKRGVSFGSETWRAVLRVLKPGAHLLAFGSSRTFHRIATAIEDAGFELRDTIFWAYATGFPKSLDVSRAIDKAAGAKRVRGPMKRGGERLARLKDGKRDGGGRWGNESGRNPYTTVYQTNDAKRWAGWHTALKPAFEPIILARKPLGEKTVAANVLKWGTGALNIDGCRVSHSNSVDLAASKSKNPGRRDKVTSGTYGKDRPQQSVNSKGRWPANLVLSHSPDCVREGAKKVKGDLRKTGSGKRRKGFYDVGSPSGSREPNARVYGNETVEVWNCVPDCPVAMLDRQSGRVGDHGKGRVANSGLRPKKSVRGRIIRMPNASTVQHRVESGASRFFFCSKAGRKERGEGNDHPTVKPLKLMRYLVRLVTPPGGIVLDPFAGSGTTGIAALEEGFRFLGIEIDQGHSKLARKRIRSRRKS